MLNSQDVSEYLKIAANGLEARCDASSFESVRCTYQADSGVWYYEALIVTPGIMQIGWATKSSKFLNYVSYKWLTELQGKKSRVNFLKFLYTGRLWHWRWWIFDCLRWLSEFNLVWSWIYSAQSSTVEAWRYTRLFVEYRTRRSCFLFEWNSACIQFTTLQICQVGCFLLFHKFCFSAQILVVHPFLSYRSGFFAAASFMSFQQCEFNFGSKPFKYAPKGIVVSAFNDHALLTPEQKIILPRQVSVLQTTYTFFKLYRFKQVEEVGAAETNQYSWRFLFTVLRCPSCHNASSLPSSVR